MTQEQLITANEARKLSQEGQKLARQEHQRLKQEHAKLMNKTHQQIEDDLDNFLTALKNTDISPDFVKLLNKRIQGCAQRTSDTYITVSVEDVLDNMPYCVNGVATTSSMGNIYENLVVEIKGFNTQGKKSKDGKQKPDYFLRANLMTQLVKIIDKKLGNLVKKNGYTLNLIYVPLYKNYWDLSWGDK